MSTEHEEIKQTPAPNAPSVPTESADAAVVQIGGRKARPVIFYIAIMFAVALFLILLSFFMQQRNHEALIEGISDSALSVQTIVDLELDKERLIEELSKAKADKEAAQKENEENKAKAEESARATLALQYLMEARLLAQEGRKNDARKVLESMEGKDLVRALPTAVAAEGQSVPKTAYENLKNELS